MMQRGWSHRVFGGALLLAASVAVLPIATILVADATTSCKTLADKDSTFMTALVTMNMLSDEALNDLPLDQVFASVNKELPWLSQCVAAVDPLTVFAQVLTSSTLTACMKTLNTTVLPEALTADTFKTVVCPLYNDTVIPCVMDGVVDIATRALSSSATGGCCDALNAKIAESFGSNLTTMVDLLLQFIGNAVCAQKSVTGASSTTTQYCGQAWLSAFGSQQVDTLAMLGFAQIPSSQVCDAMAGASFLNTLASKATLPLAAASIAEVGICFQPVDLLLQHLRDFPIMKSYAMVTSTATNASTPLANLFTADKCIPGDALIDWLTLPSNPLLTFVGVYDALMTVYPSPPLPASNASSNSGKDPNVQTNLTTILASSLGSWRNAAKAFCFHLPTGASCKYNGQQIAYPYSEAATTQISASATSFAVPSSRHASPLTMAAELSVSGFIVLATLS